MNIRKSAPQAQVATEILARPLSSSPHSGAPANFAELPPDRQPSSLATIGASPVLESVAHAAGNLMRPSGRHVRKGKIARLPRLERDMVNRMLRNNIPYSTIVEALDEHSICVTQRNISNWRTRGGYREWCAEQERQLQLSLMQDNLTDYLRKNDAGQLPEVGLQVAATQLSSMLLQPDVVQHLAAEPEKYSKVVDMLCRLSTHIQSLQKDRNEAVRKAAIRGTSEHLRREDEEAVELTRSVYSSKQGEGPRDPDIPHRNDLPRRDKLPFQEPPFQPPSFNDQLDWVRSTGHSLPGIPAPQPKPAENPAAENNPQKPKP
jgi:hypothetical protein